jgi:putative lipoprotein
MLRSRAQTARNTCTRWTVALLAGMATEPVWAADADPWLGPDKALHFGVSAGLATGGYALTALWSDHRGVRAAVGGAVAVTAGAAKELYDLGGGGSPSWKDFTWDLLGAATGVGISYVVDRWLWPRPAPTPVQARATLPSGPFAFDTTPAWVR